MMHTPTSSAHPPDALPQPNRRSYLDDDGYGFAPARTSAGGGKHAYHDPYVTGSAGESGVGDSSWMRAPDYPPPVEGDAYDLGQQRGQLLSAAGGGDEHVPRAYSDVGSSTSLGPDDSASVYRAAPYNAGGGQQGYYQPPSHLSYVPEEEVYATRPLSYNDRAGLVDGAEPFAGHPAEGYRQGPGQQQSYAHGGLDGEAEDAWQGKGQRFGDLEYSNPPHLSQDRSIPIEPTFASLTWGERVLESLGIGAEKRFSVETRIENRRRGVGRQRRPWVTFALCIAMVAVFAYELARNSALTGSVIATKPTFNWMVGPSSATLINMGARFVPCMKPVAAAPLDYPVACFNDTRSSVPTSEACLLGSYCGLSPTDTPNQTYRFFVPIFLHAGVVHLLLNGVVLYVVGGQIEREIGSLSFAVIFFAGAVFGFLFGANFALPAVPSVGASGGIFAINAVAVVDLGLHWKLEARPKLKLVFLIFEFALMVGMGFIPYLIDNFAHLGGFICGLLLGVILYPAIALSKRAKIVVWVLRAAALVLLVLGFVLIIINFSKEDSAAACAWCRYLSCIPVAATNFCSGSGLPQITTSSSTKRSLFEL